MSFQIKNKKKEEQTGLLLKWKVSADILIKAYSEVHAWNEEEIIHWFGKDLDFLNNGATGSHPGARYRNFGRYTTGRQNYQSRWESMPLRLRQIIPLSSMGSYIDQYNREYKPRTEDPDNSEYGLYELRLPHKYYLPDRRLDALSFPRRGDGLILKGKDKELLCEARSDSYQIKHSTALIQLDILRDQILLD